MRAHVLSTVCLFVCCLFCCVQVGTDFLEEAITANEDLIQSVDIAAFNKV